METTYTAGQLTGRTPRIRLIALDMDGTLLADDKHCPPENLVALEQAAAAGIYIVPASGRLFDSLPEAIRTLPFVRYGITMNGADVYDAATRTHIRQAPMTHEVAEQVFDYLAALPVLYDCFLGGEAWIDRTFSAQWEAFVPDVPTRQILQQSRQPVDDFRSFVRQSDQPVQKIIALFRDLELRQRVIEELRSAFPNLTITSAMYNNIEINAADANKGEGLRALCAHLGIDLRESMAIGDGDNDVSMLRAAGVGVAMQNAAPAVKLAADAVTVRDNNAGGVAEAILRYALGTERAECDG